MKAFERGKSDPPTKTQARIIERMAQDPAYTWKDVAKYARCTVYLAKQHCKRNGIKFAWDSPAKVARNTQIYLAIRRGISYETRAEKYGLVRSTLQRIYAVECEKRGEG